MHELRLKGKSHVIPKQLVWDAWLKVKDNGGAAGVDGVSIEQFEEGLRDNLYVLWNRMSSGSYFPGPVRAVEIPKQGGTRVLGIPNVVDRVAQTAAAMALEPSVEPMFHEDSYAYRPGRSHPCHDPPGPLLRLPQPQDQDTEACHDDPLPDRAHWYVARTIHLRGAFPVEGTRYPARPA